MRLVVDRGGYDQAPTRRCGAVGNRRTTSAWPSAARRTRLDVVLRPRGRRLARRRARAAVARAAARTGGRALGRGRRGLRARTGARSRRPWCATRTRGGIARGLARGGGAAGRAAAAGR